MSRIMLGLMRIGSLKKEELENLIEQALNLGINQFDIADIYGGTYCETLLGEVLEKRKDLREKMYIQTKAGISYKTKGYDSSYDYLVEGLKSSLERMKIDYVDSFLIHRPDIFMDNVEVKDAITYLKNNGLIKDFGVSNFTSSQIEYLLDVMDGEIKYNQVQLGLGNTTMLDQTMYTNLPNHIVSKEADDLYFYLKRKHITIQCWSPFMVGFFEGSLFDENKYPQINEALSKMAKKYNTSKCSIATSFLLSLNKDIVVITGSTNIDHIKECVDGESIKLSKEDWYTLYQESGKMLP